MTGARFTPQRRIATLGGDVLHGLKATDPDYAGFGEAYFSMVEPGAVKGWKRHNRMTLNLLVPAGAIRFVVADEGGGPEAFDLSPDDGRHGRLTVPPGLWMAFQGRGPGLNLLCNVASLPHDPAEADTRPLDAIAWDWAR